MAVPTALLDSAEQAIRAGNLESARQNLSAARAGVTLQDFARTELLMGLLHRASGDSLAALQSFQRAAQQARTLRQAELQADALVQLAKEQHRQLHSQEALHTLEQARDLRRALADHEGEIGAMCNQATILILLGQQAEALACLTEAEAKLAQADSPLTRVEIHVRNNLGLLLMQMERYSEARAQFTDGRELALELGDTASAAAAALNVGEMSRQLGDYAHAEQWLKTALEEARSLNNTNLEALALQSLGLLQLATGDPVEGDRAVQQALHLAEQQGDLEAQIDALLGRGRALLQRQDVGAAVQDGARALTLAQTGGRKQAQLDALMLLADAHEEQHPAQAVQHLRQIMVLQQEMGDAAREQQLRDLTVRTELEGARRRAEYERQLRSRAEQTVQSQLAELERGRLYDPLTGLPNRLLLHAHLNQAMEQAAREGTPFAVATLDLDRFQVLNDMYGHDIGDDLLRHLATRLQRTLRGGDTLARVGGDEFTLILSDTAGPGRHAGPGLPERLNQLARAISEGCWIGNEQVKLSGSLGVACWPEHGQDTDSLRRAAELAMQDAKQHHHPWVMYDVHAHAQTGLEGALSRALSRGEFELHYQPQVEVGSGRVVCAEALLRWNSPMGAQSPSAFIPLLERNGLIVDVGDWVLHEACRAATAWQGVRVAVNLSARQFASGDVIGSVQSALHSSGLKPESLELEITETLMMQSPEQAVRTLDRLQGLGCRVVLDDFGTGYSSLGYLARFPLSGLKLDRSLVQVADPRTAGRNTAIMRAVVQLAEELGLELVAEGVESAGQLNALKALGVRLMQGFYFAMPQPRWSPPPAPLPDGRPAQG